MKALGLKENNKGPSYLFSLRGKVALLFLKHYGCCSDKKLIEQLNANIDYQIFYDMIIPPGSRLTNFKIVSQLRCELGSLLDIDKQEGIGWLLAGVLPGQRQCGL